MKPKILFAHITHSKDAAQLDADAYRDDRRNRHGSRWSVRIYPRTVRAGGATIPCYAVVVRQKKGTPT